MKKLTTMDNLYKKGDSVKIIEFGNLTKYVNKLIFKIHSVNIDTNGESLFNLIEDKDDIPHYFNFRAEQLQKIN